MKINYSPGLSRYGFCLNEVRIRVFNNTDEYNDFVRSKLSEDQISKTKAILENFEALMLQDDRNAPCRKNFTYLNKWILDNFENTFDADNVKKRLKDSNEASLKKLATSGSSNCQVTNMPYGTKRFTVLQLVIFSIAFMIMASPFEYFNA